MIEAKNTLIIDVRESDAYAQGHLVNSINILNSIDGVKEYEFNLK